MAVKVLVVLVLLKLISSLPNSNVHVKVQIVVDDIGGNPSTPIEYFEADFPEENYNTSAYCPFSQRLRSGFPFCRDDLSYKYQDVRDAIVRYINLELGGSELSQSTDEPAIFKAIKTIDKGYIISESNQLITVTDENEWKKFKGPLFEKMGLLRQSWAMDLPTMTQNLDEFLSEVKSFLEKVIDKDITKDWNSAIFKKKELEHIFYGSKTKSKKGNGFTGLHDGSALSAKDNTGKTGPGLHTIVGGTVVGVKKIGPGVVLHIMNPEILWRGENTKKENMLKKPETTLFLGIPPVAQAAFYMTAFYDEAKNLFGDSNRIGVEICETGEEYPKPSTTEPVTEDNGPSTTVSGEEDPNPLTVEILKKKTGNVVIFAQGFPKFMYDGEQYTELKRIEEAAKQSTTQKSPKK